MNEILEQNLVNSAQIRLDLNDNLHKQASKIRKEFKEIFNVDPKVFTTFKDLKYYRGGYPSPNTPARIDVLCDKISDLLNLSDYVGDNELQEQLASRGIEIKFTEKKVYNITIPTEEISDAFNYLLNSALEVQKEICTEADKIKIDGYNSFNEESLEEIQKSDYILCVQNKCKELKKLDNSNIIEGFNKRKLSIEVTEKYI